MLQSLLSHIQTYRARGHAGFLAEWTAPVLVVDPFQPLDGTGFQTLRGSALLRGSPTVGKIEKRAGTNPFSQMITLGRASNNDIEVKAASVSKFHAYFTLDGSGEVFVTDSGSSFGTKVGGQPLTPKIPSKLRSGDQLTIGTLGAAFYVPRDFADFLKSQITSTPEA